MSNLNTERADMPEDVAQEPACKWAHGPVADLDARGLCRVCAEDEDPQP